MKNVRGKFTKSDKSIYSMGNEERIAVLKSQLAYQRGKLDYTQRNGGRKEKVQYHLDKIEYIESKLKSYGVEV